MLSCHVPARCVFPFFFFYCSGHHRDLHSFPTRRSSDLCAAERPTSVSPPLRRSRSWCVFHRPRRARKRVGRRSEEHTSELQSHSDLVCRLLLEKKNRTMKQTCTSDRLTTDINSKGCPRA